MLGFSRFEIAGVVALLVAVVAVPWAALASIDAARAKHQVADLTRRIDGPEGYVVQVERCSGNRKRLEAELKIQNDAVDGLKAAADAARVRGEAAVAAARRDADGLRARADRLAHAAPAAGEDQCAAADRIIRESLS